MDDLWEGKTVENAIVSALQDLNRTREEVEIEVIQEPVKGIFGIVKTAKVRVVPIQPRTERPAHAVAPPLRERPAMREANAQDLERGVRAAEDLLRHMGLEGTGVSGRIESGSVVIDLKNEDEGLLIGRHGRTREALQYLIDRIANQNQKEKSKYIVDVGGYLNSQKEALQKLAQRAVDKVKVSRGQEHLPPMNAFDRRIVHLYLKDHPDVETFSQGEGETRHIVVASRSGSKTAPEI